MTLLPSIEPHCKHYSGDMTSGHDILQFRSTNMVEDDLHASKFLTFSLKGNNTVRACQFLSLNYTEQHTKRGCLLYKVHLTSFKVSKLVLYIGLFFPHFSVLCNLCERSVGQQMKYFHIWQKSHVCIFHLFISTSKIKG